MQIAELQWWQIAIDMIVLTGCILAVIWGLKKSGGTVKGPGGTELTIGKSDPDPVPSQPASPPTAPPAAQLPVSQAPPEPEPITMEEDGHSTCPFVRDFIIVTRKTREITYEIARIKMVDIIRDQMNAAQLNINQYRAVMIRTFTELLLTKKGTDISLLNDTSYVVYCGIVDSALDEALQLLKRYFRDNHLAKREDAAFQAYLASHTKAVVDGVRTFTEIMYPSGLSPTREEIGEASKRDLIKVSELVKDCFIQARDTAIKYDKAVEELETNLETEVIRITGLEEDDL